MIHEYAIEPEALSELNSLWQALEQFGVPHGRMIAQFPKKWLKKVHEATSNCPPVRRRALEERLNRLRRKLIQSGSGREYAPDSSWCKNAALQQESENPFHAIIISDDHSESGSFLTQYDLSESNELWNVQPQKKVPRTPKDLASCVSTLGKMSNEILFIDPHFAPEERRGR